MNIENTYNKLSGMQKDDGRSGLTGQFDLKSHFSSLKSHLSLIKSHFPLIKSHLSLIKSHFPLIKSHFPLIKSHLPLIKSHFVSFIASFLIIIKMGYLKLARNLFAFICWFFLDLCFIVHSLFY